MKNVRAVAPAQNAARRLSLSGLVAPSSLPAASVAWCKRTEKPWLQDRIRQVAAEAKRLMLTWIDVWPRDGDPLAPEEGP